jgi:hypothetical protein
VGLLSSELKHEIETKLLELVGPVVELLSENYLDGYGFIPLSCEDSESVQLIDISPPHRKARRQTLTQSVFRPNKYRGAMHQSCARLPGDSVFNGFRNKKINPDLRVVVSGIKLVLSSIG